MKAVRVRFAPSPTGELHVGGLRTALFNYLFARKHGGTFILRIEDTDQARYVADAEKRIVELLTWAGIAPDEGPHVGGPHGPYRQSERLERYHEVAERLMAAGHAYRCYCSTETLYQMRQAQQAKGFATKYDGRCWRLSDAEKAENEAKGLPAVVRMRLPQPDQTVVVHDLVRGDVEFNTAQLDDQVLLKSDGFPTYHLAVVTDDTAMEITHVLRAEEWLPSTPKHLLLYQWLGWEPPQYAHLPLLLNTDRSKMSKRKGDVSVEAYREQGYLPEAMVNFVALLGWSSGDDQEIFGHAELIEKFAIERIGKTGAVFDRDKLDWMNQQYIQKLDPDAYFAAVQPILAQSGLGEAPEAQLRRMCGIVQSRLVRLTDIDKELRIFFRTDEEPIESTVAGKIKTDEARRAFAEFRNGLSAIDALEPEAFKALMQSVAKQTGVKGKQLWEPMRIALTLEEHGPDLGQVVAVLGKEKAARRIERALAG